MKASYKILLITLLLLLIFAIGCIPLVIVLFMYQTLFVRTIIALSGLVWGVLTIYYVCSRTRYTRQWHLWRYERRYKRLTRHRRRHPDYMALYSQYPKSLRRWEQHCLHKGYAPDKTIALALKVSPSEWAEREAFRQQQ